MAIIVTKEIRKRRALLAVAGGLLAVALLIIYFGIFYKPSQPATVTPAPGQSNISQPSVSDINIGIFEDERFKSLKDPPGVPIATDTPGKANPFSD